MGKKYLGTPLFSGYHFNYIFHIPWIFSTYSIKWIAVSSFIIHCMFFYYLITDISSISFIHIFLPYLSWKLSIEFVNMLDIQLNLGTFIILTILVSGVVMAIYGYAMRK
jgi:hypothetical protein